MDIRSALIKTVYQAKQEFSPLKLLSPHLVDLPWNKPIYVFALGKAAYQMTEAVLAYAKQEQYIRIMGG